MFDNFRKELAKYDKGVHRLYPPASDESIKRAESRLGIEFPHEYRIFLRSWNGGLLFAKEFFDLLMWNVSDERAESVKEYDCDLVEMNRALGDDGHPQDLLGIASYSDGNILCLDLSRRGRPVLWLRDERRIEEEWESMTAWLDCEMEEGSTRYDHHGIELE